MNKSRNHLQLFFVCCFSCVNECENGKKKMKCVLILLLCCHAASPVKHSLKFFSTVTSGVQSIPEFVAGAFVDEVQIGDFNSVRGAELKKDWIKFFEDHPRHLEWYSLQSLDSHHFFKATIETLRQLLNQTEGVHIMQRMNGCEWNDETGEINGFNLYSYDGEDFLALDLQTLTWITPKPQAVLTKLRWDAQKDRLKLNKNFLGHRCPEFLKEYLQYGRSFLQTAVLPSVSLLQKTPSSPVSCHATGFYPDRGLMFWRKDGEETHEVLWCERGHHHQTGQNSDQDQLGKDWILQEKSTDRGTFIGAAVIVLAFTIITAVTFLTYINKKSPDDGSEQSERLNPQS